MSENFPSEQIVKINSSIKRYRIHLILQDGPKYEVGFDQQRGYQHILLGRGGDDVFPQVEAFWQGSNGIGRIFPYNEWIKLDGGPFPNYLTSVIELMQNSKPSLVKEDDHFWTLEFPLNLPMIGYNADDLFNKLFDQLQSKKHHNFLARVISKVGSVESKLIVLVSKDKLHIEEVSSQIKMGSTCDSMTVSFEQIETEIPQFPEGIGSLKVSPVSIETLLFRMETTGGWSEEKSHCPWAQCSIDLIADNDADGKYKEIYEWKYKDEVLNSFLNTKPYTLDTVDKPDKNRHPIVVGVYNEDIREVFPPFYGEWFNQDPLFNITRNFVTPYKRDYNHFGGEAAGLERHWYFAADNAPDPDVGNAYYSAHNWGYGLGLVNENFNRMTFTEAITQYNRYQWEGKRNAYLILGHIIHLLQDQGQPDHARLVAHPASGMDEPEAYAMFRYCIIKGLLYLPLYFIIKRVCEESADPNKVGYEKLIGKKWRYLDLTTDIQTRDHYDSFFRDMCSYSIGEANRLKLSSALGCGSLLLFPGIAPNIHSDNEDEIKPYFELTESLVPNIIGLSAGLIQNFYEIVNHPPYVQHVKIVKVADSEPSLQPLGFGELNAALRSNVQVCYDAEWKDENTIPPSRRMLIAVNKPLSPNYIAYIFIQFGPNLEPFKSKIVREDTLSLRLIKKTQINPIDLIVPLNRATSESIGTYYWGLFKPANTGSESYTLSLEIQAKDSSAHLMQRQEPGDDLNSDPSMVPLADVRIPPYYSFLYYLPGPDKNHSIQVGPPMMEDTETTLSNTTTDIR